MSDETAPIFPADPLSRRGFLRGGALLAGSVLIGLAAVRTGSAESASAETPLALAYWNETRLVDAARLAAGDPSLCATGLRVTVRHQAGPERTLHALSALCGIGAPEQGRSVPYHAWTAGPHGSKRSAFCISIHPAHDLTLIVRHAASAAGPREETVCRLVVGRTPGRPKLRAGVYALAAGGTDWRGLTFQPAADDRMARLTRLTPTGEMPLAFDCLLLTVRPI